MSQKSSNFAPKFGARMKTNIQSSKSESQETILRKLNLLTDKGELTNAALMLFGKDIERWRPLSAFSIGRFGVSQADLIIHDNIVCPLVLMPDAVVDTLRTKYLVSTVGYEGLHRKETLELPEEGLREMICNAIMHRDYMGTFIQMRVWADRIQLWNDGTLPPSLTIEKLMTEHESRPRNPLIAKVFYLLGFIENWGRGYEKIRESFEQAHLQVPTFEQVRGGFMATIQREIFQKVQGGQTNTDSTTQKRDQKSTLKSTLIDTLKGTRKSIMEIISNNPTITLDQIASQLGKNPRGIDKHVKILRELGVLRRVDGKNGGRWEIIR
jgi:ATP-dependent DNA helicase RecG